RLIIPAQTVIQSQFAGDLPAILDIQPQLVIAELAVGRSVEVHRVRQTREEAGVSKTGRVCRAEPRNERLPRIGGLGCVESKVSVGAPEARYRIAFLRIFAAGFEG